MSFKNLGLAEPLVRALEAKGYTTPTPIQRDAIPTVLTGRDLLPARGGINFPLSKEEMRWHLAYFDIPA